jgi:hypothetical protein
LLLGRIEIIGQGVDGVLIILLRRHLQQVAGIAKGAIQRVNGLDDFLKRRALTTQLLSILGLVPDGWVFEFAFDLDQAFTSDIVVKDTPSGHRHALAYP